MHPRRSLSSLLVAATLWSGGPLAAGVPAVEPPGLVETVAEVDRSLLHVTAGEWVGSGFLFGGDRWVVTNRHVVESVGLDGSVTLRPLAESPDGRMSLGSRIAGVVRVMHPSLDLAVIELLDEPPAESRPLARVLGDRLRPRGTEVLVHGFPATMVPTISRGIVSAHHHDFADDDPLYLLDAASGSGSSGGPVTDREGRLMGVATAVYDVPEELGFAWCFAIPVSQVASMFDDAGRPRIAPRAAPLDELVARVRNAEPGTPRIEAFRDGLAEVIDTRTTLRTAASDLLAFVERTQSYLVLRSARDGRLFMEAALEISAAGARRGAELGLLGDESIEDPAFNAEMVEQQARLEAIGAEIMQRQLSRAGEDIAVEVATGVLDAVAERAEIVARATKGAIERIEPLAAGDVQAIRESGRDSMIEAMTDLVMLQVLVEFRGQMPEVTMEMRREMPPAMRTAVDRFDVAMSRVERQWAGLPDDIRFLIEDDVPIEDAAGIRDMLRADGFSLAVGSPATFRIPASGSVRTFEIRRGEEPGMMAFLAESMEGIDIDLVLVDPGGEIVNVDEAIDSFPVVVATPVRAGRWSLRILNADEIPTEVRLEQWTLP